MLSKPGSICHAQIMYDVHCYDAVSYTHLDVYKRQIISTLHEGDSVIKVGSINDSFQASGESSIVGGGNERHSTDKEVGSEHTETKKSTDEQGYGLNHGSSLGTGDANSGTTAVSYTHLDVYKRQGI